MKKHLQKIVNHKAAKTTGKILNIKLKILLFLLLPIVVFTLIASRTDIVNGVKSYVVQTGSMEPALPVGSITYTKSQPTYNKGDIITFENNAGQTVTHRVESVAKNENGTEYITKGDANKNPDTQLVPEKSIKGKVVFSVPFVGKIMNYLKSPQGFALIIIVPTLLFIIQQLLEIKKEIEKSVEKKILARFEKKSDHLIQNE